MYAITHTSLNHLICLITQNCFCPILIQFDGYWMKSRSRVCTQAPNTLALLAKSFAPKKCVCWQSIVERIWLLCTTLDYPTIQKTIPLHSTPYFTQCLVLFRIENIPFEWNSCRIFHIFSSSSPHSHTPLSYTLICEIEFDAVMVAKERQQLLNKFHL